MTNIEKFTETKDVMVAFEEYKRHGGLLPLEKWLYLETEGENVPYLFDAARDFVSVAEKNGAGGEYFRLCYRLLKRAVHAEEERLLKMAARQKESETNRPPVRVCSGFRNFERFGSADEAIAAATFPEDLVMRYFGSGKYDDAVLTQIARQFVEIDHSDGEDFWTEDKTLYDCDREVWCKFYAFCKGWIEGFSTIVMDGTSDNGKRIHDEPLCFYCEFKSRWYPVNTYVSNPHHEQWCAKEFIKKVVPNGVKRDKRKRK